MTAPANVRAGRATALFAGLQSAKGTPIADFTSAAAKRLWTTYAEIEHADARSDPSGWMTRTQVETKASFPMARSRQGVISCEATPTAIEWLLRSNWGTYAGGVFTLANGVSEWLTLAWVESTATGSPMKFLRVHDGWVHTLRLSAGIAGALRLDALYAAERDSDAQTLSGLVGITLPPAPMEPSDKNVFAGKSVRLFRDPAGANQEIGLHGMELTLDQGLIAEWDMMRGCDYVARRGHPGPLVELQFEAHVSDETWAILTDARGGTKARYRLEATAPSPAKTLRIDLYEVIFDIEPLGHEGQGYRRFRASGRAHRDSAGNFVSISLT